MARRTRRGFIAIPPKRNTIWSATIKGTDITNFILSAIFPHGLISEELVCEIELNNIGETLQGKFSARDVIEFKMDFSNGTTTQFKGEVEEVKSVLEGGFFKLRIKGAHFTSQFLDVLVTKEFTNAAISTIRTTLINDFASDFTTTNIEENTTTIDIKFVNKPLLDCLLTLDVEGDEDTYIDFNKDVHTFKKGSKQNLNIHFTMDDSIITLTGLGTDSAEVRNKITVFGEAGGLDVIHTSEDTASQTTFRTKESVITDTSIVNETQAQELGDAEKKQLKDPLNQGSLESLYWTGVNPGDKAYIISPPHNIHDLFRIVKFVYKVPFETMHVFFNKERSVPKLFKDRIKKDLAQDRISNPFNMIRSFNFTFDNENKIDGTSSADFIVEEGKLRKDASVETGTMVSNVLTSDKTANSMELRLIGEFLDGAAYSFRVSNVADFQSITPNSSSATTVTDKGKQITLKIVITNVNTRIDSAALYWK